MIKISGSHKERGNRQNDVSELIEDLVPKYKISL